MADMTAQALNTVNLVTQELETQSLNAIVGGFAFAAALSWMDLVRFLVQAIVRVKNNGGAHYALTALLTTVLSIAVFLVVRAVNKDIKRPAQSIYAVTR